MTIRFFQLTEELKKSNGKMTDAAKQYIKDGMRTGFLQLDESMTSFTGDDTGDEKEKERSGTTAICAIMTPEHMFVANLGKPSFMRRPNKLMNIFRGFSWCGFA